MEIDNKIFTKFQCISYTWRDLYKDIVEFWDSDKFNLLEELENRIEESNEKREEMDPKWRKYLEDKKLVKFLRIPPSFKNVNLEKYIYYTESMESKKIRDQIRKEKIRKWMDRKRTHLLDMSIISNSKIRMMREVVELVSAEGGSCSYDDLKLLGDKDPHHQVNNAIKLNLIYKKKNIITLTEIGEKYVLANEKKKKEILRNQIENIEIFNILLRRLRIKKKIRKEEIAKLISEVTGKIFSEKTRDTRSRIIINWLKELDIVQYDPKTGILTYLDDSGAGGIRIVG